MITDNKLYRVKAGYMVEEIGEQYVLMAPAVGDIDYSKMLVLSESAAYAVNQFINKSLNFNAILQSVLNEYEADEELVKNELTQLLSTLDKLNVFERN